MLRFLVSVWLSVFVAFGANAQSVAPIDSLIRALGLPELLEVMNREGIAYGAEMQTDFLEGRGGARWPALVEDIYDVTQMSEILRDTLDTELEAEDLAPMIAFFTSDLGERIVALEVSARTALLDPDIEDASKASYRDLKREKGKRFALLEDLAVSADLIENNVAGALNSNYAFLVGLVEGGGTITKMSEEEILSDVWAQEGAIREDTVEWLFSYLNMAYQPLTDDEVIAYTAFFETEAGQVLNQAIFAAFDDVFSAISLALGQGASQFLAGQEL